MSKHQKTKRRSNLNRELVKLLVQNTRKNQHQKKSFSYICGVLYSNIYRIKYAEFLKIDFPRIPLTKDCKMFSKMHRYGKRLVDLHLFRSKNLDPLVANPTSAIE